ncbi:S-malonyltransferase [alpha proteobacterium BAL199]|jgi:[acyl-carrier-protein] S-malonyltransferase|nr:S-malonyltransferase [alpha proteobacterium BAL199]
MDDAKTGRAFVFPGQGSQAVGMGKDLADAYPAARAVFQEVDDALGESLSQLIWDGPEERLVLTANAQPALMAVSLAVARVLEAESGRSFAQLCDFVAGHSLGEYSALAAAGTFDVATAARLLRLRGEAMQQAVPVGVGAMAALIGAELEVAQALAAAAAEGEVCDIANDNGGGQVVLSGHAGAIDRVLALAADHGIKRAVKLTVSAPFHCALMAPAADAMADALALADPRPPVVPVVANVTAMPTTDPDAIRRQLVEQVTGRVRWRESVASFAGLGVRSMVEVGAGKVLTGLARRIDKDLAATTINGPADVDAFLASLV